MADLMGVMLKSLGVNGAEITKAATGMQGMVAEIHGMLTKLIAQNELIIVHLSEFASPRTPIAGEAERIMTRMIADGTFTGCGAEYSRDSVCGD